MIVAVTVVSSICQLMSSDTGTVGVGEAGGFEVLPEPQLTISTGANKIADKTNPSLVFTDLISFRSFDIHNSSSAANRH